MLYQNAAQVSSRNNDNTAWRSGGGDSSEKLLVHRHLMKCQSKGCEDFPAVFILAFISKSNSSHNRIKLHPA